METARTHTTLTMFVLYLAAVCGAQNNYNNNIRDQ